jgi:hypothetical protein
LLVKKSIPEKLWINQHNRKGAQEIIDGIGAETPSLYRKRIPHPPKGRVRNALDFMKSEKIVPVRQPRLVSRRDTRAACHSKLHYRFLSAVRSFCLPGVFNTRYTQSLINALLPLSALNASAASLRKPSGCGKTKYLLE